MTLGQVYALLPARCDTDNDNRGMALKWYTDDKCTASITVTDGLSYYGGYGFCARAAIAANPPTGWVDRNYVVSCAVTPGGATTGVTARSHAIVAKPSAKTGTRSLSRRNATSASSNRFV